MCCCPGGKFHILQTWIVKKNCPGGKCPGEKCSICRLESSKKCPGGKCPDGKCESKKYTGEKCLGRKCESGKSLGFPLGGKYPDGKCEGGKWLSGKCYGGKFPGGKCSIWHIQMLVTCSINFFLSSNENMKIFNWLEKSAPAKRYRLHTEKYFRNLIKSNLNQIVFTMHRLIWNSKDERWNLSPFMLFHERWNSNREMVNTIWFRFDSMRFRKDFSACT